MPGSLARSITFISPSQSSLTAILAKRRTAPAVYSPTVSSKRLAASPTRANSTMSLQPSSASFAGASSLKLRMISPSCMAPLLLNQRRRRCGQRNAGDLGPAGQHRDILRQRPMLDTGREIIGDTVAREFERQHLTGRVAVEPDHM